MRFRLPWQRDVGRLEEEVSSLRRTIRAMAEVIRNMTEKFWAFERYQLKRQARTEERLRLLERDRYQATAAFEEAKTGRWKRPERPASDLHVTRRTD